MCLKIQGGTKSPRTLILCFSDGAYLPYFPNVVFPVMGQRFKSPFYLLSDKEYFFSSYNPTLGFIVLISIFGL